MDTLAQLLEQARTGRFHKGNRFHIATSPTIPVKPPETAFKEANAVTLTQALPAGLSGAIVALTAAEQALLQNPAILAALVAEIPRDCGWHTWAEPDRRNWVSARLGLSATRFWHVTYGGRRWFVEFAELHTLEQLQEQAACNSPRSESWKTNAPAGRRRDCVGPCFAQATMQGDARNSRSIPSGGS